jgi:2-oxoglutarate ferredoxin oxidoreductase subunit gamma
MEKTLGKENILQVMLERIPKMQEENKKAFEIGYSLAAVNA